MRTCSCKCSKTHHWVLVEVIIGATRDGIELHEVVEVANLSLHPLAHKTRLLEQLGGLPNAYSTQVGRTQRQDGTVHHLNQLHQCKRGGRKTPHVLRGTQ